MILKTLHSYKCFFLFIVLFPLFYIFLSTSYVYSKNLEIRNIEIIKKFDNNFEKNQVINKGFDLAFKELIFKLVQSDDQRNVINVPLEIINTFIENFSIKEEKFINNKYFVSLDVSFNKQKIFNFLEKKNVFPSLPKKKKIMFIPIMINEDKSEIILFSENDLYINWISKNDKKDLLEYIVPNEDLDDIILIKKRLGNLENYNFEEIINKYSLNDYIISLFYFNDEKIRVLSKINLNDNLILDNQEYPIYDSLDDLYVIIKELKIKFNDLWKRENLINTSIKLPLIISIDLKDNKKIKDFENLIENMDLVSSYFVSSLDNKKIYYTLIYNGTPKSFIKNIEENGNKINFKKKIWNLE